MLLSETDCPAQAWIVLFSMNNVTYVVFKYEVRCHYYASTPCSQWRSEIGHLRLLVYLAGTEPVGFGIQRTRFSWTECWCRINATEVCRYLPRTCFIHDYSTCTIEGRSGVILQGELGVNVCSGVCLKKYDVSFGHRRKCLMGKPSFR